MPTKVFISHSSKDAETNELDPDALQLLKGVGAELRALGYTTNFDRNGDILAGADWDRQIKRWLFECHAAIILFNAAALESWWVQLEAAVLCARREVDDAFTLIPVLLDELDPTVFQRDRFKILRIEKSQCIRDKAEARDIAEEVRRTLGAPAFETPDERRRGAFASKLRRLEHEALYQAAEAIPPSVPRSGLPEAKTRLAEDISRWVFSEPSTALTHCEAVVSRMTGWITRQQAESLFAQVQCLWVPEETARLLPETAVELKRCHRERVAGDHAGLECPPPVAMNGRHLAFYTVDRYVERAYLCARELRYSTVTITSRDLNAEAVAGEIREKVRSRQRQPDPRDDEVDAQICRDLTTIIVLLPVPYASRPPLTGVSVLDELMAAYPTVLFVLDCGLHLPAPGELPLELIRLEPEIDTDDETEHYDAWQSTGTILHNLPSG